MSKTPEQMAEEYADSGLYRLKRYVDGRIKPMQGQHGLQHAACRYGFLAGYQAGRLNSEGVQAAKPQWISVKERLPEDAGEVLIVFGGGVSIACYGGDWRHPVYPMLPLLSVSHWMPLPSVEGLKNED